MNVTLKLFASLGVHLPVGAERNQAEVEVPDGTTVWGLLDAHNVRAAPATLSCSTVISRHPPCATQRC